MCLEKKAYLGEKGEGQDLLEKSFGFEIISRIQSINELKKK